MLWMWHGIIATPIVGELYSVKGGFMKFKWEPSFWRTYWKVTNLKQTSNGQLK